MNDSYGMPFSLNEFKKWMAGQTDKPSKKHHNTELIGIQVESKIGIKRLIAKINIDEGDARELAEDFKQNGGIVVDCDEDENLLIEVDSGEFIIPKYFVKKLSRFTDH